MHPMSDVVVLLPGITGSVLAKNGKELWSVSRGAIWRALTRLGRNLDDLRIDGVDDPDIEDLDGVTAPRLMPDLHLIPGLWRIDGYGKVSETIRSRFDVTKDENFFEFPYDWRRDNRVHAKRLARESRTWLADWRRKSGNDDAKLILIGHSMGGLVARAFLELEEGWTDTRYLITFGTPFAGSLNALDQIVNGFKKGIGPLSVDLSDTLRSMTSVYQLLPVYGCIDGGGGALQRPSETVGIPNLDTTRAAAARAFHREMNRSAKERFGPTGIGAGGGYETYPIVGYAQPTWQSAVVTPNGVDLKRTIGSDDPEDSPGGDGTVPEPSAMPAELLKHRKRSMFSAEVHGSLQNSDAVLSHLIGLLTPDFDPGRFRALAQEITLDCEDVFADDEEIVVSGKCSEVGIALKATVHNTETGEAVRTGFLDTDDDDGWEPAILAPLPEGSYRITLEADVGDATPVTDMFVVFGSDPEPDPDPDPDSDSAAG